MSDNPLTQRKCAPCEGHAAPMSEMEARGFLKMTPLWELDESGKSISRTYRMKNFMAAVDFIGQVAGIAEDEDHHPDLHLTGYRNLRIVLSTHAIGGLSENDFIVAAKVGELAPDLKGEN
ncbi:MAG: 4a-hydroxytetrahydrobiopterin dehydratase [Candidatus Omnitrophica bacterium]|nr:4a-hydroxytetrahydrobiopterin dehydratase [Candidatus Omnitrophota bacterium]MCB9721860.1 4a-hydroxytetrahydrobiopterin dehydratase [Candidatus Omnitrophota bacterium]